MEGKRRAITCPKCGHAFTVRSYFSPGLTGAQARAIWKRIEAAMDRLDKAFRRVFNIK